MNELKQELDIDDHKIPIEELYQRLGTNPETVNFSSLFCLSVRLCVCLPFSLFIEDIQPTAVFLRYQMANGTHAHDIFRLSFCHHYHPSSQPHSTSLFLSSPRRE